MRSGYNVKTLYNMKLGSVNGADIIKFSYKNLYCIPSIMLGKI